MGATSMLTDDLLGTLDDSTSDVAHAATLPAELYTNDEFLPSSTTRCSPTSGSVWDARRGSRILATGSRSRSRRSR